MTDNTKPIIVLANHSKKKMPDIKNRLTRRGFKVVTTENVIDTLSCIKGEAPHILVYQPSTLPIPEFEHESINTVLNGESKTLILLSKTTQIKKSGLMTSGFHDFYIGDNPGELTARIEFLVLRNFLDIEQSRKFKILMEQSITDYKTGLYNDRFILKRLTEEFQRADRHHTVLSVIMMDLDDFKDLNDNMGHPFADFVLQALAKHLLRLIRKIDIAGRYGGDEFLILLPNTGLDEAANIAERIRSFLVSHTFEKEGLRTHITLSQGINTYIGDSSITCDQLLKGADLAVLESKKKGKNRISLYPLLKRLSKTEEE